MSVYLRAGRAAESPKGFEMDLCGKIKAILWRRKAAGALSWQPSQGAFSFLNANSSTFPCCSVGKSCYPTSHPAHQLRNPERQAIGCNPAARLNYGISIQEMLPDQCINVTKAMRGEGASAL